MHRGIADSGSRPQDDGASEGGRRTPAPSLSRRRSEAVRIALIVATLLAVPCIQLIPETWSESGTGTLTDPIMLLGSGSTVNDSVNFYNNSDQIPTYFDLNTEYFLNPTVEITIRAYNYSNPSGGGGSGNWAGFENWRQVLTAKYAWNGNTRELVDSWPEHAGLTAISSEGSLSIKEVDPLNGFYVVAFSGKPPLKTGNGYFLIGIKVVVKEGDADNHYDHDPYYFGANNRYQGHGSSGLTPEDIIINQAQGICLFYNNGQTIVTTPTTINIQHHENIGPFMARVVVKIDSQDPNVGPRWEIDPKWGDYVYYASGLPDGLNMKSDGTIEGKLAGYAEASTVTMTIYAVAKDYTTNRVS